MTISEKSNLLRKKLKINEQNKKVLENIENSSNNLMLAYVGAKNNSYFEENFKETGYKTKDNCTYQITAKNKNITEKLLCNFVAFIDEEITIDDGVEMRKIFKIIGKDKEGYSLPTIDVYENEFASLNWVMKKWGARCIIESGQATRDNLRCCVQKTSKNIKNKTVFGFTGWHNINGKWIYLHSDGAVGKNNVEVQLGGRLTKYKLPEIIDFSSKSPLEIIEDFTNLAPKEIILPLLSLVFLTPLNEFLKQSGYEPNFVVYLLGKTGCGKSTLTALFLSFFGIFSGTELPMSFMDTSNAIISKTFALKDFLTCIDDYKPSNRVDLNAMDKIAQNLVRSYGECTGRQRLKSDSSEMKQKYPRGNAIFTGEQMPNIGESGTVRMIVLELKKDDINFEEISKLQENARNNVYSSIMKSYVEWIQKTFLDENEDLFVEILKNDFQ